MALRLGAIVEALGGELCGSPELNITSLAPLGQAGPGALSFLSHPRYQRELHGTRASCVIVAPEFRDAAASRGACIVSAQPYLYFARVTQLWRRHLAAPQGPRVHPSAVIDPQAQVHETASIGPFCVVEAGASVGAGTVLKSHVTLGASCSIGRRGIVHAGVVIGADGFGFAPSDGRWEKIEQLGAVIIGDDVEIGANTCIDRGALGDTRIADGVKLDNLIQIGHNVSVGAHTAMAACVGIAGSASIGANCTLGGGAIVLGHLQVVDHVHISAASVVSRSITRPGHYTGFFPLDSNERWEKNAAVVKRLHAMRAQLRGLDRDS